MEKEEKVMVLLLFMTLTSLMTAYLCFGSELTAFGQETGEEAKPYTRESGEGEKVFLQAEVLSKQFQYFAKNPSSMFSPYSFTSDIPPLI